ncbi:MAG: glycosyl hydrolase 2 galactose-binding domain-containing protein [Janthinobacterium lividum]
MLRTDADEWERPPLAWSAAEQANGAWIDAPVPGTVAGALRRVGRFDAAAPAHLADADYWYRLRVEGSGARILRLHGLATLAEVWLDDACLLRSRNMFAAYDVPLQLPANGSASLYLCFRSLDAAVARQRGRGRWRPKMIDAQPLRAIRTTLLGHMPGWCPSIDVIGPWRPVELIDPAVPLALTAAILRPSLVGDDGWLDIQLELAAPWSAFAEEPGAGAVTVSAGGYETTLLVTGPSTLTGRLCIPSVGKWWPRSHGEAVLYAVTARCGDQRIELGTTGFRSLEVARGDDGEGFTLVVNGVPIFARGACWTSADLVDMPDNREACLRWLRPAVDAGFNMVRVGGTMAYESDAFHAACDELGLMVWQDFMFANFDYPADAADFTDEVSREARQLIARTRSSPSLMVLCGGSEIEQQAAMLGLPPAARELPLFANILAELVAQLRPDVCYVSNSPSGGVLPFAARTGVTHYYGVGAYLRPLDDARRAGVRFASECLAFANVPCEATVTEMGAPAVHDPRWKAAVPRDAGAPWDFEDVRDHYLQTLYGVDAPRLRYEDPQRYLEMSRAVVADLMQTVFSEWRRPQSPCAGALVWQLQDLRPGAGWGLIDAHGRPKSAWHALRQVSASRQILLVDESVNGLDVHVLNETSTPLRALVEVVALRDGRTAIARCDVEIKIAAHGAWRANAAELLGRFFDFTYAYRFGPREHDAVVATLRSLEDGTVLSEAFYFPERSNAREAIDWTTRLEERDGVWWVDIETSRLARYVHVVVPGFIARDDWFHLVPGRMARVALLADVEHTMATRLSAKRIVPCGEVRAINSNKPSLIKGTL